MSEAPGNKLRFPTFKSAPKVSSNASIASKEVAAAELDTESLQRLFDRREENISRQPSKDEAFIPSKDDFIALPTVNTMLDTKDWSGPVSSRQTESLHAKLRQDPCNVELWLEFANQQELGHLLSPLQSAERQHAILAKALQANPKSFVLLERLLQIESVLLDPLALLKSWDKHLRRWKRNAEVGADDLWALTKKFICFRLLHFQSYNVALLETVFREVFEQVSDCPFSTRTELLCIYLAFLARSGKTEKLAAIVSTVCELNRSSVDIDEFGGQWDAGLYAHFPRESSDPAERDVPSVLSKCAGWAWREQCRTRAFWYPRFGSDDPEQELSFDGDIRPFILRASDPQTSKTLVRSVLSCLLHSAGLLSLSPPDAGLKDLPLFSTRVALEGAVVQRHLCWDDMVRQFDGDNIYSMLIDHFTAMPLTMVQFLFRIFESLLPLFTDDLSFLTYFFVLSEFQMLEVELLAYIRRFLSDNRTTRTAFIAYGRFLMLRGAVDEAEKVLTQVAQRHKTKDVAVFLCELYAKRRQMASLYSVLSWFFHGGSLVIGRNDDFDKSACRFDEIDDSDLMPYCQLVSTRAFASKISSAKGMSLLMRLCDKSPITEQFELFKTLLPKALDCVMASSRPADLYCLGESFARIENAVKYKRGFQAFLQENAGKLGESGQIFALELLMLWQAKACGSDEQAMTRFRNWLRGVHLKSPLLAVTYAKLEREAPVNVYEMMRVFPGFKQLHLELATWTESIVVIDVLDEQEVRLRTFVEEFA